MSLLQTYHHSGAVFATYLLAASHAPAAMFFVRIPPLAPFAPFVPAPQIASHHCVHPAFIPSGSDRADPFCSSALCPPPPRPPV